VKVATATSRRMDIFTVAYHSDVLNTWDRSVLHIYIYIYVYIKRQSIDTSCYNTRHMSDNYIIVCVSKLSVITFTLIVFTNSWKDLCPIPHLINHVEAITHTVVVSRLYPHSDPIRLTITGKIYIYRVANNFVIFNEIWYSSLSFDYVTLLKSTTSTIYLLTITLFFWRPYALRYTAPNCTVTTNRIINWAKYKTVLSNLPNTTLNDRPSTFSQLIWQLIV